MQNSGLETIQSKKIDYQNSISINDQNIRVMGRATQGVRLIKLNDDDKISSVAKIEIIDDENEEYEVPVTINEEEGLTAIRFAEDVLPERSTEDDDQKKKKRRAPRRYEDEEDEDFEYSGRIH